MKNNFITKIIGATLAFAMMIGGAVGINVAKQAKEVNAAATTVSWAGTTALPGTATAIAGDTNVTIKTSSTNTYTNPIRVYANTTVTIQAQGNCYLKSVTYEASSTGNYVTYAQEATVSPNTTPTVSGKNVTWAWDGTSTTAFTFKPASQTRANSITVIYDSTGGGGNTPTTYTVTYDANGATSGTVPTDSTQYEDGATVTVLGNTGSLAKTDYTFGGWTDGENPRSVGSTFQIHANTTLYAVWNYIRQYTEDENAKTITWDLSKPEFVSASSTQISWESPKATMVANKASASTATNNYCPPAQTSTRFYKNSTLTITPADGYQINKIEFTASTANYATALTDSSWTNAEAVANSTIVTVTPTDKKIAFSATLGDTTGASKAVVYYSVAVYTPTLTLDKTAVSMKTNNTTGVTVTATVDNVVSPSYSWTTNDSNITLVNPTSRTVTIKPNTEEPGSATVHLTIADTDLEADVAVTLTSPLPGETAGTAYTVQQAKDSIDENDAQNGVYVRGIISQIDEYFSNYHSITYWISDDGTTTNQFEVYSGKGLNNANFSSVDDLVLGSTVVIYGNIKLYSGVYEFGSGSKIVSLVLPPQVNSITLTPSEITIEPNESGEIADLFTSISINQDDGSNKTVSDIVWTSDDEDVLLIDDHEYLVTGEHRTSTTIRASIGGTEYGSAIINVINPAIHYVPYNVPVSWTKLNSLTAGDQIVFIYEASDKELTNIESVSGTMVGTISDYNENPTGSFLLTVEAGSENNSFAFKTPNDTYLSWSSGNSLTTSETKNNNSSWTINTTSNGALGDWKFNNVATTDRVLQINPGASRFACYTSNQTAFQIYKKNGGYSSAVDLLSASSTATLHATESNEGGNLTLSDVKIRFGAKLSIAEWEAVEAIGNITDYGVMFFRTRNVIASETPVQDAINNGKTPTIISKGSGEVPSDPENGYYSFTGTVNITKESNYDLVFCAAPFIEVDGTAYFLDELQFSVNSLANYIIDHNVETELSDDALLLLA